MGWSFLLSKKIRYEQKAEELFNTISAHNCVSCGFIAVIKMCDNKLQEDKFIWAHNFRVFNLWLANSTALGWDESEHYGRVCVEKKSGSAPNISEEEIAQGKTRDKI